MFLLIQYIVKAAITPNRKHWPIGGSRGVSGLKPPFGILVNLLKFSVRLKVVPFLVFVVKLLVFANNIATACWVMANLFLYSYSKWQHTMLNNWLTYFFPFPKLDWKTVAVKLSVWVAQNVWMTSYLKVISHDVCHRWSAANTLGLSYNHLRNLKSWNRKSRKY